MFELFFRTIGFQHGSSTKKGVAISCREKSDTENDKEESAFPLDDLPSLVIDQILDQLSYEDLFGLRRTCKRWKATVDRRKFKKLILFVDAYASPKKLFYTNEPVCYANSLRINDLTPLESASFRATFVHLHTLAIFFDPPVIEHLVSDLIVDLNALNCFKELKFLQIDLVGFVDGRLNLNQLKVCFLKARLESNFELADCHQLEALAVLEFARPDLQSALAFKRLTYLYVDSLHLELHKFESLRVLCFGMLSSLETVLDQINSGQLSLPALREIRILDWASCYFGREQFVERLRAFEKNECSKEISIYLGDRLISAEALANTLNLVASFDSKAKHFGAVLSTDYLLFLHRKADRLNFLFPFIRKLVVDEDLEISGANRKIKELCLENLEMLVLCSCFAESRGQLVCCETTESWPPKQNELSPKRADTCSSTCSSISSNSSCHSSSPTTDTRSYRASELFFKFWIKRWPRIRYLELQNHFNQTDLNSLACLLNLKNLTFTRYHPENLDFVPRLRNLQILEFRSETVADQRPLLTETQFVFLFKQAPSLRELHLRKIALLLKVMKRHRNCFKIIKHDLTKEKSIKITEFHSVRSTCNYVFRKLSRSTL